MNEENISKVKLIRQNLNMKRRQKKQGVNTKKIHEEVAEAATEPQKSICCFKLTKTFKSINKYLLYNVVANPELITDNSKKNAKKILTGDDSNLSNQEEESKTFLDEKSSSACDDSLNNNSNNY